MTSWLQTHRAGSGDEYRCILAALYDLAGRGAAVDLGCGEAHTTKEWPMCLLVDLVPRQAVIVCGRSIEQMDMRNAPAFFARERRSFNFALMSDSLEHLTKADGEKIVAEMLPLTKAMAIFVPTGPWHIDETSIHPDAHKSEWWPQEFADNGWSVWEWPNYHLIAGRTLGAFWAWKFLDGQQDAEELAFRAAITL